MGKHSKKQGQRPDLNALRHVQRRPGFADDYLANEPTLIPQSEIDIEDLQNEDPDKARRFRAAKADGSPLISSRPHVEAALGNPLVILHLQLEQLKMMAVEAAQRGEMLDYDSLSRTLKITDMITKLTKEMRAQAAAEQVEEMDRDTLAEKLKLAQDVLFGEDE